MSTHKKRAAWFQARASWPVRDAPVRALVRERTRARSALPALAGLGRWESVGPSNIGGRLSALVCDPRDADRIWAGAAGGGVWHSADGGRRWQPQWHDQDVLNVGSLALSPAHPDHLYCGTGEANLSADSYPGVGIYHSLDGGQSWNLLASAAKARIPPRIGVIAVDPFDDRRIWIGGVGLAEAAADDAVGGIYRSVNGGQRWKRLSFVSSGNYWCHSIVLDPSRQGVAYVAVTARGSASGIYRTVDDGRHWEQLTTGLPPPERFARTSLTLCAAFPQTIFALAADAASYRADLTLGVFRSDDGGDNWVDVTASGIRSESQMSYGNAIAVHPQDPDLVVCGGVDLHLSRDGGKSWCQVTHWDAGRDDRDYAHADHHALVFPAGKPDRLYSANDGGLDVSEDRGRTWQNRSAGLAATMFYDFDLAQSDARRFGGGSQDNGTLVTKTGRADGYFELLGGDGGWLVFDPADAGHVFASYYNLHIFRFRGGGYRDVSPPADEDEQRSVWMCFIAMHPADSRVLFTGSDRVWRTLDDGDRWDPVSPVLDDSPITAIDLSPHDRRRVYVGTENGGIFRSLDGGDTWSPNLASATLPGHTITRLVSDPTDADRVFASVANFGHGHAFLSVDGARTWKDIDRGQLPDVPHHSMVLADDGRLFICGDAGVFATADEGTSWLDVTGNLPNVMVVDLAYHRLGRTLTAATYGRSAWRLTL